MRFAALHKLRDITSVTYRLRNGEGSGAETGSVLYRVTQQNKAWVAPISLLQKPEKAVSISSVFFYVLEFLSLTYTL